MNPKTWEASGHIAGFKSLADFVLAITIQGRSYNRKLPKDKEKQLLSTVE